MISRLVFECGTIQMLRLLVCSKTTVFLFCACAFVNMFNDLESLTSSTNATENTAESDVIHYECSVAFSGSGKISPSIRWTSEGTDVTDGVAATPSANRADSVYTVTAGTSNIPSSSCEVYFTQTNVSGDDAAQNIPTYTDSHSLEEIVVTCKLFLASYLIARFYCNDISKNVHCLSK